MEAVGSAASIVQLIDTLAKTIRYLNAVKKAPKERSDLLIQATDLSARLAKLQLKYEECKQNPGTAWNAGMDSLGPVLELFERKLQSIMEKLVEKDGIGKTIQRFKWPFDKTTAVDFLNEIQRINLLVVLALQEDLAELALAIKDDTALLPKLGQLLRDVNDQVVQLRQNEDVSKMQAMTDWFSPLNFLTTQAETLANSQPGTGAWFLKDTILQDWILHSGQVVWAPGIPGAGKTIMTSIVVDYLKQKYDSDPAIRVGVAYCSYKDEQTQSLSNILCGLWRQIILSESNHSKDFQELYKKHNKSKTRPTIKQISEILHKEIEKHDRVFLVVDALDELPHSTIDSVVGALQALNPKTNLLFTSRNLSVISELFLGRPTIEISAQDEDITSLVEAHIRQSSKLAKIMQRFPDLRDETIQTIVDSAENMFLLAKLYLDSLASQPKVRDFRKALKTLPSGLNATYDAAIQRIRQMDETEMGIKVLYWIAFASRPLTFVELDHALAVEPGDTFFDEEGRLLEDITSLCAGLIEISPVFNIVRLAHYTTQSYLTDRAERLFPSCSNDMALTCLTYLSYDELVIEDENVKIGTHELTAKYPFLEYAALNWGVHYANLPRPDQQLQEIALDFLQLSHRSSDFLVSSQRSTRYYPESDAKLTGLHLAALFDLKEEAETLLQREGYAKHELEWTNSPLDWAVELNRRDLAAMFIRAGADASHSRSTPANALHVAASQGHSDMIRLLLELGADPDTRVSAYEPHCWHLYIMSYRQTPLHEACLRGHVEAARVLIEHGADVNLGLHLRPDVTPLVWTLNQIDEWTALIDLLLDNGANVTLSDAITVCIQRRSLSVLQKLVDHGLEVNYKDPTGRRALDVAIEQREKEKIKLLLDNSATTGIVWSEDDELISTHRGEYWYRDLKDAIKTVDAKPQAPPDLAQERSDELVFTRIQRDTSYLDINIPDTLSMPVSTIVIHTESHDQGWSDYPDNHGTYSNAHTWFELRVAGDDIPERNPCRFQSNIHASRKWKRHTNKLNRADVSADTLLMFDDLRPGTILRLYARAEFPGWANYVKFARIEVFGAGTDSSS